ncbi:MAG: serine hydrolase, partial [Candidatus Aminicenantes bacterium]|nr:serine hydrolase [Candidatus Aminicenantes bacterium]
MKLRCIPRCLAVLIIALVLFTAVSRADSSIDIDRLTAKLEPEIQRMMLEGRIPSATIALVHEDRIIWTGAFGYSNLWARTPAVPSTVYLIGSTFKTMSMFALLQQ